MTFLIRNYVSLLRLILFTGLIGRLIFFLYVNSFKGNFVPDEAAYSQATLWVSNGLPMKDFPGLGSGVYNRSKTFLLLSSLLARAGLEPLLSVRLISCLFSIMFLTLSYFLSLSAFSQAVNTKRFGLIAVLTSFSAISLLPSSIFWSSVGLRETTSHFFLLSTCLAFSVLIRQQRFFTSALAIFSVCFILNFGVRTQSAQVLTLVLFIFLFFRKLDLRKRAYLSLLLICLTILGNFYTFDSNHDNISNSNSADSQITVSENPDSFVSNSNSADSQITVSENPDSFISNTVRSPLATLLNLDQNRELNTLTANSALNVELCPEGTLNKVICNLQAAPTQLFSFFILPIPFISSGSMNLQFASFENIFWYFLYFLFMFSLYKSRSLLKLSKTESPILISVLFTVVFSLLVSLSIGNLGTGFRLRSSLLWSFHMAMTAILRKL